MSSPYIVNANPKTKVDAYGVSALSSYTVMNYTNRVVYMMSPDGSVSELTPNCSPMVSVCNQYIVLRSITRIGIQSNIHTDIDVYMDLDGNTPYPGYEIRVPVTSLNHEAIYIKELGIALATNNRKEQLSAVHRLGDGYSRAAIIEAQREFIGNGSTSPLVLSVNSHDEKLENYYIVINGNIHTVHVTHNVCAPEEVLFHWHRGEDDLWMVKTLGITDVEEVSLHEGTFIVGSNREAVRKLLNEKRVNTRNLLTPAEVEIRINEAVRDLQKQMDGITKERDQLKASVDQLTRELSLTKKDTQLDDLEIQKNVTKATEQLSETNQRLQQTNKLLTEDLKNTTTELRQANAPMNMSTEQFLAAQRTATAQMQYETLLAKSRTEAERAEEKHQREMHQMQIEHKHEKAINELKVQKEQQSTYSAEVSTLGTVAKTLAVILPIAASVGFYLSSRGSSELIAGVANSLGFRALGGVGALATSAIGTLVSLGTEVVTNVVDTVGSVITNTINTICSAAESVWSWLTS